MLTRCFIIEDEPIAVEILESYIRRTPFLETAGKAAYLDNAMELLSKAKPGLLFLDLNTRGLDKSLIEGVIRNRKGMHIILTTAYPREYIKNVLQINVDGTGHLDKPFTYETFLKEVERIIK